jgi:iron only hydrogenase large subunit-like protein
LDEEPLDNPLGEGSGAGVIFGAAGGVMEAALRSVYYLSTRENPEADTFKKVRGRDGWKEAEFNINNKTIRVAAASGLANARELIEALRKGEVQYDFIEIMACPGGCVGGGGQPIISSSERLDMEDDYRGLRGEALYVQDEKLPLRKSHTNPQIIALYEEFLKEPLSEKSHKYLHTHYTARPKFSGIEVESVMEQEAATTKDQH